MPTVPPSPTVTRRPPWLLLASLYGTQFLGLMFFVVALAAILREGGASLDTVGLVYMLGMIWPLKFLWAPWVDRIRLGRLGHYRGWLLVSQGTLMLALLALGRFDPLADFGVVYALCVLVAFAASTQDIAVDGLACLVLDPSQRGIGNGLQVAGGLVGNLIGGGAMLMAYPVLGWTGCTLVLALLTGISFMQVLWFREPAWRAGSASAARLFGRALTFWRQPGSASWLAVLLFYTLGSGIGYAVLTPVLVDAGWRLERIGLVMNVYGSLAGLLAALAAGWALARLGRRAGMIGAAVLQLLGVVAVLPLAAGHVGAAGATAAVIGYFLLHSPAAAVLSTLMMDRASGDSPATDYALQFCVNQFVVHAMIAGSVTLAGSIGYSGVVGIGVAGCVLAIVLAWRHRPVVANTAIVRAP